MANTGQYDSQTNIETEDYEREIFVRPEAAVIYGGSVVNSVNGQTGDVTLTTSDLENTSDYQTGAQVQNAIAGKQDKLTAGANVQINNNTISATDTTYSAFTGTDGTAAGAAGLVPAPATTDAGKFLKADGTWDTAGGGGGGTSDYEDLSNLPKLNNVTLKGNKSLSDLGIQPAGDYALESEIPDVSNFQTKIDSSHKLSSDLVDDTNQTNKFVTTSEKQTWNNKYDKPNSGIPKTDLASAVQTSLGKADTALQSISSSDVTSALGYTPYNSTNPNGYTSNVGTITGITMNGVSKGTSGVVDLGTVITSHQDISGKANKISVVQTSASTIEINPNTFYKFGEVASLTITLASITDNTIYNEYMFEFVSGTTATTLTLPSSIKWLETPTIDANKIYQCSIVDNVGLLVGVANV